MRDRADQARHELLETVAESDEELLEKYLSGEELTRDDIISGVRKSCLKLQAVPVICGSSFKNKGVQPLLDAVLFYLPSPVDVPPVEGGDPDDAEKVVVREADDSSPFSSLVFKIIADPHGTLSFIRVYSGQVKNGDMVLNVRTGRKSRIGRLVKMHANKREEVEMLETGDIAAVIGLKDSHTGDTLCDDRHPVVLESIEFPEPVISVAIEPKTKADQDRLSSALGKVSQEDPSFRVQTDDETGQTIIAGMGELHLEIIVDRLTREFKVGANVGKPQVAYREAIEKSVEKDHRYVRQSGGRGQYGHVVIRVYPRKRGEGFEFVNSIRGGTIPKEYFAAIEKGIVDALSGGVLAGYPVIDVGVELLDGSYHEVDSSEMAFKVCASQAVKEAAKESGLRLLEPIMSVEVVTPDNFVANVVGDINRRRGRIHGMEPRAGAQVIKGEVPLGEMFGYATDVRSQTQGRATFTMQFSNYDFVPAQVAEAIISR
jgi:elongation factor G